VSIRAKVRGKCYLIIGQGKKVRGLASSMVMPQRAGPPWLAKGLLCRQDAAVYFRIL